MIETTETQSREDALAAAFGLLDSFAGEGLGHIHADGQQVDADTTVTTLCAAFGIEPDVGWHRELAQLLADGAIDIDAVTGCADDQGVFAQVDASLVGAHFESASPFALAPVVGVNSNGRWEAAFWRTGMQAAAKIAEDAKPSVYWVDGKPNAAAFVTGAEIAAEILAAAEKGPM